MCIRDSIRLGVDSRHADQQVRGSVVLPNGTGKTRRVLVFAKDAKADAAREAGADYVGGMDMVEKIQKENFFDYDEMCIRDSIITTGCCTPAAACRPPAGLVRRSWKQSQQRGGNPPAVPCRL